MENMHIDVRANGLSTYIYQSEEIGEHFQAFPKCIATLPLRTGSWSVALSLGQDTQSDKSLLHIAWQIAVKPTSCDMGNFQEKFCHCDHSNKCSGLNLCD